MSQKAPGFADARSRSGVGYSVQTSWGAQSGVWSASFTSSSKWSPAKEPAFKCEPIRAAELNQLALKAERRSVRRRAATRAKKKGYAGLRAVIYTRTSTPGQKWSAHERQTDEAQEYADRNGIVVVGRFSDVGLSGMLLDRPGQREALRMLANDEADILLVETGDRSDRSLKGFIDTWTAVMDLGKQFHDSQRGEIDDPLIAAVIAGVAASERVKDNRLMADGRAAAHEDGLLMRRIPYGFTKGPTNGVPTRVPSEIHVIEGIYADILEGMTVLDIADKLTAAGIPSPTGKDSWCVGTVTQIATRAAYTGYIYDPMYVEVDGEIRVNTNPDDEITLQIDGFISKEAFADVQNLIKPQSRGGGGSVWHRNNHLLSEKLICAGCGNAMSITKDAYSGCGRAICQSLRSVCYNDRFAYNYDVIERTIVNEFLNLIDTPEDHAAYVAAAEAQIAEKKRLRSIAMNEVDDRLNNIKSQLTILMSQSALGKFQSTLLTEALSSLDRQYNDAEIEKSILQSQGISDREREIRRLMDYYEAMQRVRDAQTLSGPSEEKVKLRWRIAPAISEISVSKAGRDLILLAFKLDFREIDEIHRNDVVSFEKVIIGPSSPIRRDRDKQELTLSYQSGDWTIDSKTWKKVRLPFLNSRIGHIAKLSESSLKQCVELTIARLYTYSTQMDQAEIMGSYRRLVGMFMNEYMDTGKALISKHGVGTFNPNISNDAEMVENGRHTINRPHEVVDLVDFIVDEAA